MFLQVIETGIAGNMKHPGREMAIITIRLSIFQNAEKHILHQIFRNRSITEHPAEEVEQRGVIAVEQDAEFADVTVAYGVH